MAIVVENGSGVRGAVSYIDTPFVTSYLTERGRELENGWKIASLSDQEASVVKATDYIEQRFRQKFKGNKTYLDLSKARAVLLFTAQPLNGETVTVGSDTFTFVGTVVTATDVLIDTFLSLTIANLIAAINENSTEVTSESFFGQSMLTLAVPSGEDGNSIVSTTDVTGASWNFAVLNGGNDQSFAQPLSFPRISLFDKDGAAILGIPERLKQSVSEYAVRALSSSLLTDPTTDATGRVVSSKLEKVGPIEEAVVYETGTASTNILGVYPAADLLLKDFLGSVGGVLR